MKEDEMLMRKGRRLQFLKSHTAKPRKREVLAMNFLLVMLAPLFLSACERKTVVKVTGGNPPTFVISGSGELGEVIITKPAAEQTKNPLDEENVLWRIRAIQMPGKAVEAVGSLTYGVTPQGYRQSVPEQGAAPTLEDNKTYGYLFVTADAPVGAGYFEIHNGQTVSVQ
jgi:hypothetical protein